MNTQRVTLITLGVEDLKRSRAFYEAIGWRAHASSNDDIVFFQANGMVFGLYPLEALADDQQRPVEELGKGATTLAINFSSEEEVDAFFALALGSGASLVKKPQKVFWGGYSGYFADPDGHRWEIAMNPFWPLSEDGSLTLPDVQPASAD
ncbi:VOC family protein [Rhodobacteraceae bacterium RKSG542]|uniref:VOC family protein n=1 Tax=Pseudovibrio flavus TaxID=2529854 RepID=UPI0012BB7B07|nr:VOC family protein [Pseudovibrio flavus]MTI18726.1 VOC family protein [Pseudovibrio flavus]